MKYLVQVIDNRSREVIEEELCDTETDSKTAVSNKKYVYRNRNCSFSILDVADAYQLDYVEEV